MTNDDLRALATNIVEHVVRDRGGNAKDYATFAYRELVILRDNVLEEAAVMAEECVDIVDFHKLPGKIRMLKDY